MSAEGRGSGSAAGGGPVPVQQQQVVVTSSSGAGSAGTGGFVYVWEPQTGVVLRSFKQNQSGTRSLAGIPRASNGVGGAQVEHLVSLQSSKPSLHCWGWAEDRVRFKSSCPEPLRSVVASPCGTWVAAGGASGKCYVWEVATGLLLKSWPCHFKAVACLAITTCGTFLVSGGKDALVHVWTLLDVLSVGGSATQRLLPVVSFSDHTLAITDVKCTEGGPSGRVVTASLDCTCKMWDIATKSLLLSVVCPTFVTAVAVDPLEMRLFMGSGNGPIYEADLHAAAVAATNAHSRHIGAGIGSEDALQVFTGHSNAVTSLVVGEDGDWLVSASADGTARVWDCASRQQLRVFDKHQGAVTSVIAVKRAPQAMRTGLHPADYPDCIAPFRKTVVPPGTGLLTTTVPAIDAWNGVQQGTGEVSRTAAVLAATGSANPTVVPAAEVESAMPPAESRGNAAAAANVAALEAKVAQLQNENARWKAVNNKMLEMMQKGQAVGAPGADAPPSAAQRGVKRKEPTDVGAGGGAASAATDNSDDGFLSLDVTPEERKSAAEGAKRTQPQGRGRAKKSRRRTTS